MEYLLRYTGKISSQSIPEEYDGFFYSSIDESSAYVVIRYPYSKSNGHIPSSTVLPRKFEQLTLQITDQLEVQMLNCTRFKQQSYVGSYDDFSYGFESSFEGSPTNVSGRQALFDSAMFTVPGILRWGERYAYKRTHAYSENHLIDIDFKATESVELYANESYSIEYRVNANDPWDFSSEDLHLTQVPCLIIRSSMGKPIDFYLKTVRNLLKIIEMSMEEYLDYSKVTVSQKNSKSEIGENDFEVKVYRHIREIVQQSRAFDPLFTLNDLIEKGNLSDWMDNKGEILRPIIDLYSGVYEQESITVVTYFLNICQALESYYDRSVCNDKKKFIKRVKDETIQYQPQWRDFIIKAPQYRNITLSERLADLLFCNGRILMILSGPFKFADFPKQVSDTRNYLTHYDPSREKSALKGEDLHNACHLLMRLLEYYLLLELGFSDDFAEQVIREKVKYEIPLMRLNKEIDAIDQKNFPNLSSKE